MFGFLKKGHSEVNSRFRKQVEIDGVDQAGFRVTQVMHQKLSPSREVALQFVLEELDAARQGNVQSKKFAAESGFDVSEYHGALAKTSWVGEVSDLEEMQQFKAAFAYHLKDDIDLMVGLSLSVVDWTMKDWFFGKYARNRFTNFGWSDESIDKFMHVLDMYKDDEFRISALSIQIAGVGDPELVMKLKEIEDIIIQISIEEEEEISQVAGLIQVSYKQIHGEDLY